MIHPTGSCFYWYSLLPPSWLALARIELYITCHHFIGVIVTSSNKKVLLSMVFDRDPSIQIGPVVEDYLKLTVRVQKEVD